jgi:hypothetical protein
LVASQCQHAGGIGPFWREAGDPIHELLRTLYTQKLGWHQAVYNTDTGILILTSSTHSEDDFLALEVWRLLAWLLSFQEILHVKAAEEQRGTE